MSASAPNSLSYIKSEKISLKAHPSLDEKWLQDRLASDPSLLGLGTDLELLDREFKVPSGGKLDLLFKDREDGTRYAVEAQLGAIDPSHIIRTIEYWLFLKDAPKCVPVLVAEEFLRFSNVVAHFKGPFGLVAIQVQARQIANQVTLALNILFDKEDESAEPADRAYWEKSVPTALPLVDEIFKIAQSIEPGLQPKYNQHYISAAKGGNNFLTFQPQQSAVRLNIRTARTDELDSKVSALGGEFKRGKYRFKLSPENVTTQIVALTDLIQRAYAGWS
jgi:hypothetical protein